MSRLALQILARVHCPRESFRASNGYIQSWRMLSGVRNVHFHGAGRAGNAEMAETQMKKLRDKLIGVDPDLVFNIVGAVLYYRFVSTGSYVLARHTRETRGTALQHAKGRLTVIMCVTATGTFKFLATIGKAAKPVRFRNCPGDLPIQYWSQCNGWMNQVVDRAWRKEVLAFF